MSPANAVGLPEALERAASALPEHADAIRPANGDPAQLSQLLGPGAAAAVLTWLLTHEADAGAELATAWAEDPGAAGQALLQLDGSGLPKAGRKALRRAHHRLRSQGLDLPAPKQETRVAKLPPVEDELDAALLSPVDPIGARVAYLVESNPSGGARLFEVILDDQRGIVSLEVYDTGRSQVRRFLREFSQRKRFPAVPAEPEAVRALVARVAAEQPADRPLPRGFTEWRSHIANAPEGAATPGERARAELGPEARPEARLPRVAELLREHQIGPWPPGDDVLQAAAAQIAELGKSTIVVSEARRRERVAEAVGEAVERIFDEAFRARSARRFEETAYVLWKGGREDDARACLAAADSLRDGVAADHPVARAMLEMVLAPVIRELETKGGGESDEEPSLLVEP